MNPTEAQEAEVLTQYLRLKGYVFSHIPNETGGSPEAKRRGVRMKRQGVSPGFPDYLIINKQNQLIAIELKRIGGNSGNEAQRQWIRDLKNAGVPARICKGFEKAKEFLHETEHDTQLKRIQEDLF